LHQGRARKLDDIDNPLERAVFEASYHSRQQQARRLCAALTFGTWHALRGLLLLWPIWLAGLLLLTRHPDIPQTVLLLSIFLPGIAISLAILLRGVHADDRRKVAGRLLERGVFASMLRH